MEPEEGEQVVSDLYGRLLVKKTLSPGVRSVYPVESTRCQIEIEEIRFDCDRASAEAVELAKLERDRSVYLGGESHSGACRVGEAASFLDGEVERCLLNVYLHEVCRVRMVYADAAGRRRLQVSFALRLVDVENADDPTKSLPPTEWELPEKIAHAERFKEAGARLIAEGRTLDAFRQFSAALRTLLLLRPEDKDAAAASPADARQLDALKAKLYNNLAHCQLRYGEHEACAALCDRALALEPDNVKALYRRGCARAGLARFEEAHADMERVLALDPSVAEARAKVRELGAKVRTINAEYAKAIKNMFA